MIFFCSCSQQDFSADSFLGAVQVNQIVVVNVVERMLKNYLVPLGLLFALTISLPSQALPLTDGKHTLSSKVSEAKATSDQPQAAEVSKPNTSTPQGPGTDTSNNPTATPDEKPSIRYDAKRKKFLEGKLAFWFENYKKAHDIWLTLAQEGHGEAQASLAWMHHKGVGVPQDYTKAAEWYRKAAEQGIATAQTNMGYFYENGLGMEQNFTEAAKWYQKAADQNYEYANFNLGLLYLEGKGVEKNREFAVNLLLNAYKQGVDEVKTILEPLGIKVPERKKVDHKPRTTDAHGGKPVPVLPQPAQPASPAEVIDDK